MSEEGNEEKRQKISPFSAHIPLPVGEVVLGEEPAWAKEKIDYEREYKERFENAKREAEAQGLKYNYPGNKITAGWKIHLAVSDDPENPLTKQVAEFVKKQRFIYKVGSGGTQEEGKGMTIYIGDKDTTEQLAKALNLQFGEVLPPQRPQVKHDDIQIDNNVWARFDVAFYPTRFGEMGQYGYGGISFLADDLSRVMDNWYSPQERLSWEEGRARADKILKEEFGAFYTGTNIRSDDKS